MSLSREMPLSAEYSSRSKSGLSNNEVNTLFLNFLFVFMPLYTAQMYRLLQFNNDTARGGVVADTQTVGVFSTLSTEPRCQALLCSQYKKRLPGYYPRQPFNKNLSDALLRINRYIWNWAKHSLYINSTLRTTSRPSTSCS